LHGGQQPVANAHVYLFAANTTGYGGNGIAASASNASLSLLNAASTGQYDGIGAYVLSDANGNFSITGDYNCTVGQQVYLYALGGQPTTGVTNSAIGLMAAVGTCPSGGSFLPTIPFVMVNEVSTIAAAYALAGFATDAIHVSSSGTTLAQTGIANAFANAANLANISTGSALATTPSGNGIAPQSTVNTLADILAACINSAGSASSNCSTLLTNAESAGTSGTVPTDTATAAINIAHNPGTSVTTLYGLVAGIASPFAPSLATAPNDFTLGLVFSSGGGMDNPDAVAIDATGNAWLANLSNNSVTEISPAGYFLSGTSGYTGGGIQFPNSIAIDQSGNAWISDNFSTNVTEIPAAGSAPFVPVSYSIGVYSNTDSVDLDGMGNVWLTGNSNTVVKFPSSSPGSAMTDFTMRGGNKSAIDGAGHIWITINSPNAYAVGYLSSGGPFTSTSVPMNDPGGLAFDSNGNLWVANTLGRSLYGFSNTGIWKSFAGLSFQPFYLAIDGAGNIWIPGNGLNSLVEVSNSGTLISPATGYTGSGWVGSTGIAVDGSGNVWMTGAGVAEIIGAAAPVITPLCAGLPATPTTNGSSNLGTRP
jgi:sugar lactone lactonase YvrE